MATQAIQAGGAQAVPYAPRRRPRVAVEPSLLPTIRWVAVVVLVVLAFCGTVASASWEVAGTTPPDRPEPGLDL